MKQQTIRAWREEKKLTQYELSELSGVAQATISNLESGATVTVKPSTIRKLARAMGIGFEQIDLSEVRLLKENTNPSVAVPDDLPMRMQAARKQMQWSQDRLALETDLTQKTISTIESGEKKQVKRKTIDCITKVIDPILEGVTLNPEDFAPAAKPKKAEKKKSAEPIKVQVILTGTPQEIAEKLLRLGDVESEEYKCKH